MKSRKRNVAITLLVIFLLMVLVIIYTTRMFYRISVANIYEVGEDKCSGLSVTLENYLDTAKSVLWVTADTVDNMLKNKDSLQRVEQYLIEESKNQEEQFDENYTGIYGYVQGEYLDGLGWVPPEDFNPLERDWYLAAKKAAGESTIVSPYVDAQTNAVIISFSRLLSDKESAISLDVTMNKIQSMIQETKLKEKGYGFIVNEDGIIIAHHNPDRNGKNLQEIAGYEGLMEELAEKKNGYFRMKVNGDDCTIFTSGVLDQWYVVLIVKDEELYKDVWSQLLVNVLVYLISFSVISLVCIVAYRNEWKNSQRIEELKINEQKKEYEARVLRLEKSAADAANKAKGDFLAEMSHEIRTPINAVLGMNEMILRESKEKNTLQYAESIQTSGKNLLSIINDILDFSKIEDGKMEILPVSYDLAGLIHNLVISIQGRAQAKGLEFQVLVDENLPSVLFGDDVRVTQVIMNLLTNAMKYTEKGRVTFSISDGGREKGSAFLNVCVRDTGIGIKEEDRAKLFESFERLDETRNRNIEGTGLGMAIVVKLLSMMGSEIQVVSEYGKGSAFSFRLRQGIVNDTPIGDYTERIQRSEKRKKEKAYLYAPEASVLVVDDNGMNLQVVKNLMKRCGIVPDLVSSGAEAIEKIKEKHYEVVLLDHMMPRMDGIETLTKLKEERLLPEDTRVIALTANAVVGARETYLSAGFDDYLSKPIDVSLMEEKLARYLPESFISYRSDEEQKKKEEQKKEEEPEILEFLPEDGETKESEESNEELLTRIGTLGINVKSGLAYCADDPEFYLGMLKDYAESQNEKSKELSEFFEAKNWKEYQIMIHALKTMNKTIGAEELSEKARLLEVASGEVNEEFLLQEHPIFLSEYRAFATKLDHILTT